MSDEKILPPLPGQPYPLPPDWPTGPEPYPWPRRPRPFPWLTAIRARRAKRAAELARRDARRVQPDSLRWVEETQYVGGPTMSETKSRCIRCGDPETPKRALEGGLMWAVELCQACTQQLAGKALRKVVRRFLKEQLDE